MKNKRYFFDKFYIHSFFRCLGSILLVLIFANNRAFGSVPKCTAGINEVDDNLIQLGTADSGTNKLFLIVKKDEFDRGNICYTATDNYVICDTARIGNNCTNEIACESGYGMACDNSGCKCKNKAGVEGKLVESGKCDDFNNYISFESKDTKLKKACYPGNHICLRYESYYKNNERLYRKNIQNESNRFYVYKKNIINSGVNKNCEFYVFPCDYKIKNESVSTLNTGQSQINMVASGTANDNNKLFVENIFGSLGDMSFFIQAGECNIIGNNVNSSVCTGSCSRDSGGNQCSIAEVLKKNYYYKYYDSSRNILYYYEKNIAAGKENNIGKICNKYLPNCIDLRPNDSMVVLYQNKSTGANNIEARKNFYKINISSDFSVNEANLYYLSSPGAADALCLSKEGTNNIDVSYCSDINADGSLKYKDGLTSVRFENNNTKNKPNCYLKSCIDLTPEEFAAIKNKGQIDKKYCSEYYWLSNSKGLKYFPKEKPIYCSDVENGHLKFASGRTYTSRICDKFKDNKTDKGCEREIVKNYDSSGGLDREKGNCYLKNCYSLSKEERELVANAKINNLALEIERACTDGSNCDYQSKFNYDNMPVYCDNGFLFNKDTPGYTNFDPVNLNVIPCYEFQSEQLTNIDAGRVLLFTKLIGKDARHGMGDEKYNTDNSFAFCRTHYIPLNLVSKADDNNDKESFLKTRVILANEKEKIRGTSYSGRLENWDINNYKNETPENFDIKYFHDDMGYQKVKFTSRKLDEFKDINNYTNILSFVDNVFPYYNADIASMKPSNILSSSDKINSVIDVIKQKNSDFYECLKKEKTDESKNLANDEKCNGCIGANQDECLYKKGGDCRKYVTLEYECKVEKCDTKDNVTKNYCYVENFAKEKVLDADSYISKTNSTSYLDCSLYAYASTSNEEYKKFTSDILSGFLKENGKDKLSIIKAACDDLLPIVDERELPEANILQQLLKPNKVDVNDFSDNNNPFIKHLFLIGITPGKHDLERYGCTSFDNVDLLSYGLYGCKLPDVASSYFNTILNPTKLYNNYKKPTVDIKISDLSICSRYKDSVFNNKCGQREGGLYKDKCLDFSLDGIDDYNQNELDGKESSIWIFRESTGGSRFRTFRENRDIYAIRDFHTYHYCSSTEKFKGKDGTGTGVIYGTGVAVSALPVGIACAAGCAGAGPFYPLCIGICIPVGIAAAAAIYLAVRYDQWNLSLQNDLHIVRGYNLNNYQNKGLITPALLTDNNNYVYRFYSRSENIEEDLNNKLNANSGYFKENTLGIDILKKCGISITPEDSGSEVINFGLLELTKSNHDNEVGYDFSYKIKKFEDNDKVSSSDCSESNIKNCLNKTQQKCVEGYGVSFFDGNFNREINNNFVLRDGSFLKRYRMGDIAKDSWGTASNENRSWLPVDIVYNTLNTQSEDNENCKIGLFGDPIGDLSRCRGFGLDCKNSSDKNICDKLGGDFNEIQVFFTESQTLKLPLAGHPFFFYTLLTPKNTPEMFDPSIFVEKFCKYDTDTSDCEEKMIPNNGEIVLNFFEPILKINYEYNGGVANDDFKNHFANDNNFISYISSLTSGNPSDDYSYSCPYILKYKSNYMQTEKKYIYVLHRVFEQGAHNEYTPKVCLYKIISTTNENSANTVYNFYVSDKCPIKKGILDKNGYIIIDNNVMCFPRATLDFDDLVLAESQNINYNRPYINSKIIDKKKKVDYKLRQDNKDDITDFGENRDLGFGLNFTRSYCSKLYYDYYKYIDQLERGKNTLDQASISRINKSINSIESYIRSDCDKENGYESEFLVNESEMKSKIDNNSISDDKVVFKETTIVRKNNSAYGGFNELCVSDYDIENIFSINKEYNVSCKTTNPNNTNNSCIRITDFPEVFAFVNSANYSIETKCLLNNSSRKNTSCMATDRFVYLYLTKAEQENYAVSCENGKCRSGTNGCDEERCKLYVNLDSLERIPLKKYECILENGSINPELLTDVNDITAEIAEKISACYKGGFNYKGIVHDSVDSSNAKTQCKCETNVDTSYNNKVLKIRNMTPREYGLCIDLKKPIVCPAVRYYDSSKTYVDDNLALGKSREEMDENNQQKYYEQHLWRTTEKIVGIVPSVFYSNTLGHAEFPASIYCEKEGDCLGGSKNVTGSCLGYWKNGGTVPTATCEAKSHKGKNIYEYKLKNGTGCVRYECPSVAGIYLDEFEIDKNASNVFTTTEITDFNNIKRTDYRSFINNEEINVYSVDKRGLSNGFAAWESIVSDDFIVEGKFMNCLTGYGLAGSNYKISNESIGLSGDIKAKIKKYYEEKGKYFNNNLLNNNDRKLIYDSIYNGVTNTIGNLDGNNKPKRYCNQKGEWMSVEDVYNKMILDSSSLDNNLYHSGTTSLWLDIFNNKRNNYVSKGDLGDGASLIDRVSQYGYCERLVCREIKQPDNNYYIDEFFNEESDSGEAKDIYKIWLHSGGANWEVTSSPRNSSNKITCDEKADANSSEFSSRDLTNIFSSTNSNEFNDYIISNRYKYLKKVKGECRKEFGYYNRGTEFSLTDVGGQVEKVKALPVNKNNKSKCSLDKELCKKKCIELGIEANDCNKRCSEANLTSENCVDSRQATDFAIDGNDEPYRVCTSVGAWGEITNKCVRSCELLHLYRTNINGDLYSSDRPANVYDSNLKVENHYAISFNSSPNISEGHMESRFLMYNFRNRNLKNKNNYTQGESIFGGADWARSIVNTNDVNKYDCDSNGKCLRYIEVEGSCNGDYETKNVSNPTQYVNSAVDLNGEPIKPKRKCYEDGTWGPIENRCLLEKTCVPLSLYVSDVAKLIKKYNDASTNLSNLNYTLSEIYIEYLKNKGANNSNELLGIKAEAATAGIPISCNGIESYVGIKPLKSKNKTCNSAGCCGSEESMVCNSSDNLGTYTAGWSFNTLKLEKYFIPKTCAFALKRDIESNNIYLKYNGNINDAFNCANFNDLSDKIDRLNFSFANKVNNYPIGTPIKHYAQESKFDLVYNSINGITVENNYIIGNTNKSNINTSINNLSNKTVNINGSIGGRGGKNEIYYSHQIYATCDNRYFYNEVSGSNYYNKLAIFSCQSENGTSNFKFKPINDADSGNDNTYLLKYNSSFSLANACKPKSCGNNSYQLGWKQSYVKEFTDNSAKKFDNSNSDSKFSTLTCGDPSKYAFVIKNTNELNENNVKDYYSSNNTSYESYGFVKSLKSTCTAERSENAYNSTNEPQEVWNDSNKSSFKTINGKTANNAYDANMYGDLQYKDLPKIFCKDIAKENCETITETKIINNGSTFSKKADGENGYCVRMGCPRSNLRIVNTDSGLKALQTGNAVSNTPGTFTLPEKREGDNYYDFSDVVVIQSLNGDYYGNGPNERTIRDCYCNGTKRTDLASRRKCSSNKSGCSYKESKYYYNYPDSPYGNNVTKFVQYNNAGGTQIAGNLCGSNQDIYNDGVSEYNYNSYLESSKNSEEKQKNIVSCFENLYSKGSLSYVKENDFIEAVEESSVYVKYNDDYANKLAIVDNIKEEIDTYKVDTGKAKANANNLLKENVFSKIKINEATKDEIIVDKEKVNVEVLNNYAEGQKKDIDDYALAEAKKLYNSIPDGHSYTCLFNIKYPDKDGNYTELKDIEELTDESSRFADEEHKLYKYKGEDAALNGKKYIFIKGNNANEQVQFNITENNASITKVEVSNPSENCSRTVKATYEFTVEKHKPKEGNKIIEKYCATEGNCNCNNICTYKNNLTETDIIKEYCAAKDDCECSDDNVCTYKDNLTEADIIEKYCATEGNCTCAEKCTYNNGLTENEIKNAYCNENKEDIDNCEVVYKKKEGNQSVTINGSHYLKLEDFEEEFKKAAENKINSLKNSFDASSSNHSLNELYKKAYDFYKIENYFKNNACRIKHYNDFLEFIGVDAQVYIERSNGYQEMDFDDCSSVKFNDGDNIIFSNLISTTEPPNDDDIGPIETTNALFNYTKYIENNGMDCQKYINSDNSNNSPVIINCNLNLITESAINNYKRYFLNIFETSNNTNCSDINKCNMKAAVDYYNKMYQKEKETCEGIYDDFLSQKDNYNSSNANSIKRGLFTVMRCTPEGWIVEGKPTCKKRCTYGGVDELGKRDNDIGRLTGNYYVRVHIDNLRYTKEIDIKYNSAFKSTCVTGASMSACKYEYRFKNDGDENCSLQKVTTQCGSKSNYGDNIAYSYASNYKTSKVCRRCRARSYFNGVDNGEMIWGSVAGVSNYCHTRDYLTCLPCPNGGHICKNGGSGSRNIDYCGSKYDAVTTIGYKIYR